MKKILKDLGLICVLVLILGVLIGLAVCEPAHADKCENCEIAQADFCDGKVIVDYCAPLPEYEEEYEDCPILCGIHRCDMSYRRGQCGKPRQVEDEV